MCAKKITIIVVCVIFLAGQILPAAGEIVISPGVSQKTLIYPENGKVISSYEGSSKKNVIFIQDAHMNTSAQMNISNILKHLTWNSDVKLIGLEGAAGRFDAREFNSMPFPEIKQKVFTELLKEKKVTGPEYFTFIQKPSDVDVYGVDDIDLYIKNLATYTESLRWRKEAVKDLESIQLNVSNLKAKIFNKDLKKFDTRISSLYEAQKNYSGFLKYVLEKAKEKNVAVDEKENLKRFRDLSARKKSEFEGVDPAGLMGEVEEVIQTIKSFYYQNPDEKQLDKISEKIDLLTRFFKFELSPEEFESYESDSEIFKIGKLKKIIDDLAAKYHISLKRFGTSYAGWGESLLKLSRFYKIAKKRDKELIDRLIRLMDEKSVETAVLVAGGFHKGGIEKELQKKGISYQVVQPNLIVDLKDSQDYREAMESAGVIVNKEAGVDIFTVIPLSNLKAVKARGADSSKKVFEFWRNKVFLPYINAVRAMNQKDPEKIYVARNGYLGWMWLEDFMIAVFDSGLDLNRLNEHVARENTIRHIDNPAFHEASRGASLGNEDAVKVTLLYLTDHLTEKGKIYEPLGVEALAGHLDAVFNDPKSDVSADVEILHIQVEMEEIRKRNPTIERDQLIKEAIQNMVKKVKAQGADLVGVSLWFGTLDLGKMIYDAIQEIPETERPEFVAGGILATYNEEELLEDFPNGMILSGPGEAPTEALVEQIYRRKNGWAYDFDNIARSGTSILYHKQPRHEGGAKGAVRRIWSSLGRDKIHTGIHDRFFGLPRRDFIGRAIETGSTKHAEGSSGCQGHCTYCSQGKREPTVKSVSLLLEEVKEMSDKGAEKISFVDDVFLGGDLEKMNEFANGLLEMKHKRIRNPESSEGIDPNLVFYIATRAHLVFNPNGTKVENEFRKQIFKKLRRAGMMTINIGVESGAPSQLKRYGKGIPTSLNEKIVEVLEGITDELQKENPERDWTIGLEGGFITFDPLATLDEIQQNVDFLRKTKWRHSINYPFQQMRIQQGTSYVIMARQWGLLHEDEYNKNWLVYNYHYQRPEVARVVYHLKRWEPSVFRFFYALKQLMRAMPLKGSTPEEQKLFENYFQRLHEIQLDLLEELVKAEKADFPERARADAIKQVNEKLREYYREFLGSINNHKLWTDNAIFKDLIFRSLVINAIAYGGEKEGWDRGSAFTLTDLEKKLPYYSVNDIAKALNTLSKEGLVTAIGGVYRITGTFFTADFQYVDLPKGYRPTAAQYRYYAKDRSRSVNLIFTGLPGSGRSSTARKIAEDFQIPMINIWDLILKRYEEVKKTDFQKKLKDESKRYNDLNNAIMLLDAKGVLTEVERIQRQAMRIERGISHQKMHELALDSNLINAYEGTERFNYEVLRKLVEEKLEELDLSRGFILVGGIYLERMYQDIFHKRGIEVDHVFFFEADQDMRAKKLATYSADDRKRIVERSKRQKMMIRDQFEYFNRKGKAVRIPITALEQDAGKDAPEIQN